MEERNNNTGLVVLVTVLVMLVLGMGAFIIYDKVINKTNEPNTEENNKVDNTEENNDSNENIDNEAEEDKQTNVAYKVGDKVTLTDSSVWHVIEDSSTDNDFVMLLSSKNVNENYTVTISNAADYISTTFKNNLIKKLQASSNDIKEARLLTLNDVSSLSGISVGKLQPGTSLENGKTPTFLYEGVTMTSEYDEFDCNIMVCTNDGHVTSPGRMCASTGTDTEPIRPVITISKKYVK